MEPEAGTGGFVEPLEVVDRTDLDYGKRLAILQEWRARLVRDGAPEAELAEVDGAIQALEVGSRVQGDQSADVPPDYDTRAR